MGIWQNRLYSWARWLNTQIKVNPTQVHEQMNTLHLRFKFMEVAANMADALWSAAAAAAATAATAAEDDDEDGDDAVDPVEFRKSDEGFVEVGRAEPASLPYLMISSVETLR